LLRDALHYGVDGNEEGDPAPARDDGADVESRSAR